MANEPLFPINKGWTKNRLLNPIWPMELLTESKGFTVKVTSADDLIYKGVKRVNDLFCVRIFDLRGMRLIKQMHFDRSVGCYFK